MALTYQGDIPLQAGQIVSVSDPDDTLTPNKLVRIPAVLTVDASGNPTGGTGTSSNQVQGNVAAAATDSGNPVKTGAPYNSTLPTYTTGQRGDMQIDSRGSLHVTLFSPDTGTGLTCENGLGDGVSNGRQALAVSAYGKVFNGTTWDRTRGDVVSMFSRTPPTTKSASAVTAGSTTSQQVFAASATRSKVLIQNQDASINVFVNVGATAVAGAGNLRIAPGATLELTGTSEAINLIAASGTPAICAWQF